MHPPLLLRLAARKREIGAAPRNGCLDARRVVRVGVIEVDGVRVGEAAVWFHGCDDGGVVERGRGRAAGSGEFVGDGVGRGEAGFGVFVFKAEDHALKGDVEELESSCLGEGQLVGC